MRAVGWERARQPRNFFCAYAYRAQRGATLRSGSVPRSRRHYTMYMYVKRASMGVPGSWSSLLRDRYNATILSRPARTLVEEIFLTALHHRVRINESRRDKKHEIGRSMEGMGNARDCMSLVRAINGVSRDQTPRYRLIRRYTTVRR